MFFTQHFPLSTGVIPLTIPCYFCQCTQAQVPIEFVLGFGPPVPASISFIHTALLRQHYANHLPELLTWSYLHVRTPASTVTDRQHFPLLAAAWIVHLQLLTVNQRIAPVLPQRRLSASSSTLSLPAPERTVQSRFRPLAAPVRTASTSSSVTITPALTR